MAREKQHIIDIPDVEKVEIYAIYNSKTNKYYVGSSSNIMRRMKEHRSRIENLTAVNSKMLDDLNNESDIKNFSFLVLETFDDFQIGEWDLRKRERHYIEQLNAFDGYNCNSKLPTLNGYFGEGELLYASKRSRSKFLNEEIKIMPNRRLLDLYARLYKNGCDGESIFHNCKEEILERMSRKN